MFRDFKDVSNILFLTAILCSHKSFFINKFYGIIASLQTLTESFRIHDIQLNKIGPPMQ